MAFDPITGLLNIGEKLLDKVIPDKQAAAELKRKMVEMEVNGELEELKTRYSAIVAEAQSSDPWTSRARPSFLYVIYVMILAAIPMGIVGAFRPEIAAAITEGVGTWLTSIPDSLWALFGAGYLGYGAMRTIDKRKKV